MSEQIQEKVKEVFCKFFHDYDMSTISINHSMEDFEPEHFEYVRIAFALEDAFEFRISSQKLFPSLSGELLKRENYVDANKLTRKVATKLTRLYPHVDWNKFGKDARVERIPSYETIESVVNFVEKIRK